MRQFGLKKNENGSYRQDFEMFPLKNWKNDDIQRELFSEFFESDISCSLSTLSFYQKRARESDYNPICANATCISFTDKETVFIEAGYEVDEKYQYFIELSKAAFVHVLDEWEKVLINKPDRVVITINDDKSMTFEQIFEEKK